MAIMIPGSIEHLEGATKGEKRIFRILRSILPDDHYVWFDHPVLEKYPDFIILGPTLGIVVLEVKDWEIDSIIDMDDERVELRTTGRKPLNPYRQARSYMRGLLDIFSRYPDLKEQEGKYKGNLKFNYGYGAAFPNIYERDWAKTKFSNAIHSAYRIFRSDLDLIESKNDTQHLIRRLKGLIHSDQHFTALSGKDLDLIIKIISKKVIDRVPQPKDNKPDDEDTPSRPTPPQPPPRPVPEVKNEKNRMPLILAFFAVAISVFVMWVTFSKNAPPVPPKPAPAPSDIPKPPEQPPAPKPEIVVPQAPQKAPEATRPADRKQLPKKDPPVVSPAKIKGNISKSGEKIYHIPGQRYYDKTRPERWFKTEEEAIQAGFRKAQDIWIKGNINEKGEKIYHMPGQQYYHKTRAKEWFKTEKEAIDAGYRKSKI